MKTSILLYRAQRHRLEQQVQKSSDALHTRRILAVLYLADVQSMSAVARRLEVARSSVGHWRALWQSFGEAGLIPCRAGCPVRTMTELVLTALGELVDTSPWQQGYLRSLCSAKHAVFCADEADVELNPRIGYDWVRRGQQRKVLTPGQNQSRYLAGTPHASTGKLVWVQGSNKNSHLFIALLETLHRSYRRAKRLAIILDNYIIHKSRTVQEWLVNHPRVRLLFQPAWHPWVTRIERLWKTLHDTVTRNHTYVSMEKLMQAVTQFMTVAQPWPGNRHALAVHMEQG